MIDWFLCGALVAWGVFSCWAFVLWGKRWALRRRAHKIAVSKDAWRAERATRMYIAALENAWKWATIMPALKAVLELNRDRATAAFFGRMDLND